MSPSNKRDAVSLDNFAAKLDAGLDRVMTDAEYAKEITSETQGNPINLGPPLISPDEWAEKQTKNASAAAETWLKNVQRPRREPLAAAIAASEKRANKVRESLEQKKWEKAMAAVDEALMYETIRARGAAAYRLGVEARKAKVAARAKELQPMITELKLQIQNMPDATDADREARLLAARRGMIEIGNKRRGL